MRNSRRLDRPILSRTGKVSSFSRVASSYTERIGDGLLALISWHGEMAGMAEDDLASQRAVATRRRLYGWKTTVTEKRKTPMRHTSGLYETTIEFNASDEPYRPVR